MSLSPFSEFLQKITAYGLECFGLFYGTYRGKVIDNKDPLNLGRIKVHVQQVHGESYPDVWAWPQAPWAGNQCGFYLVPDVDQFVYVQFDHGRAECPIWNGGWWGENESHPDMKPKQILLLTPEGLRIQLDREHKRITLASGTDKLVAIDDDRIYTKHPTKVLVECPQQELLGDTIVTGKLTVTQDVSMKANLKVDVEATIGPQNIKFTTHKHPTAGSGAPSVPIP